MLKVGKAFKFEAAHFLPGHEKCGQVHGHTYKLEVEVSRISNELPPAGEMVIDLHLLTEIVNKKVISEYDHTLINKISTYPTCESIVMNILFDLETELNQVGCKCIRLKLQEGEGGWAEWTRN